MGFDDMDIRILKAIIENYGGGPVGLGTMGVAVGEDKGTIEEVYEPYLIQEGLFSAPQKEELLPKKRTTIYNKKAQLAIWAFLSPRNLGQDCLLIS